MPTITFTHCGYSAVHGSFVADQRLECTAAEAAHFVEDARCAVYADEAPAAAPVMTPPPVDAVDQLPAAAVRKNRKG